MKRNLKSVCGLMVFFVLLGLGLCFGSNVGAAGVKKHWVTFKLHDEKTKAAVNAVSYQFSGPGFNKKGVLNGSLKLGPLAAGRYKVSFNKNGYFSYNSGLDVNSNRTFNVPLAKRSDVKLVDPPKNVLSIVAIADKGLTLVDDATVTIKGPSGPKSIKLTKKNSTANFFNLKPGRYTYTVSRAGYKTVSASVDVALKGNKYLRINLSTNPIPVTVRVLLENGQAVPKASVAATSKTQVNATTNQQGIAKLTLGAGTWTIKAYRQGVQPAVLRNIKLPGKSSYDLTLKYPRGNLSISVLDGKDNRRIAAASVAISGKYGNFKARTNSSGVANFRNIPQSDYKCIVTKGGYNPATSKLMLRTTGTAKHNLKLSRVMTGLNLTVVDGKTHKPISGARINAKWKKRGNAYTKSRERAVTVTTNANGAAHLKIGSKSVIRSIIVNAAGYQSVTLKSAKIPGKMEVALQRPAAQKPIQANLEILVIDSKTKKPLPGVDVGTYVRGRRHNAKTANNGKALLRSLPAGKFNVFVSKAGFSKYQRRVEVKQSGMIRQTFRISAKPTKFAVTVLDAKGRPVHGAGVNVKWYDKSTRRYKYEKATSGKNGIALLYDVPRATQTYVSASKKGYPAAHRSLRSSYNRAPGKVTLRLAAK